MLLIYVAGVAYDAVGHRVENGFDPWWRLSHHCFPLASDFHIITLHDLHDLKPIAEGNADSFFQAAEYDIAMSSVLQFIRPVLLTKVLGRWVEIGFDV